VAIAVLSVSVPSIGVRRGKPDNTVTDDRFAYIDLDARNDLYNPVGQLLSEVKIFELEDRQFDLMCLFSVFSHRRRSRICRRAEPGDGG